MSAKGPITMNKTQELIMIGIDVAKDKLDVALDDKHTITVSNDKKKLPRAVESRPESWPGLLRHGGSRGL